MLIGAAPSTPAKLEHILVCTPALGGQNAAVILKSVHWAGASPRPGELHHL